MNKMNCLNKKFVRFPIQVYAIAFIYYELFISEFKNTHKFLYKLFQYNKIRKSLLSKTNDLCDEFWKIPEFNT